MTTPNRTPMDCRAALATIRALEFLILTAARSGEVRGATWEEIDFESKVWIVPAERMKAGREHRVPLSEAALQLLQALPRLLHDNRLVFPAPRGGVLSDMTLTAVMRRMKAAAVPISAMGTHGMASHVQPNSWCSTVGITPIANNQ